MLSAVMPLIDTQLNAEVRLHLYMLVRCTEHHKCVSFISEIMQESFLYCRSDTPVFGIHSSTLYIPHVT